MAAPSVEHVELSGGFLAACIERNASGRPLRPEGTGTPWFFVEVVDPSSDRPSARMCIWDSGDYGEAIAMAEKTRTALGIAAPVRDTVVAP